MSWNSWEEFWDMGGYAFFVWGSYSVVFAGVALELWLAMRRRSAVLGLLRRNREDAQAGDPT
ncbi:MAG: heme exporter protein CcmD [Alphaproteobacteria bacterium]|nr:heme exporter protein CcmD [Alphaproteobacteria bacterium]